MDFRGKLLGLLPIATGAGVLVLLSGKLGSEQLDGELPSWAVPVGLFGFIVTIGLFVYELRQIQICDQLMARAADLEDHLGVPPGSGQFRDRELARLGGIIGADMAGWIVYLSVAAGWLYVAGLGFEDWSVDRNGRGWLLAALMLGLLVGKAVFEIRQSSRQREADIARCHDLNSPVRLDSDSVDRLKKRHRQVRVGAIVTVGRKEGNEIVRMRIVSVCSASNGRAEFITLALANSCCDTD